MALKRGRQSFQRNRNYSYEISYEIFSYQVTYITVMISSHKCFRTIFFPELLYFIVFILVPYVLVVD